MPFDYPTFRLRRIKMQGFNVGQWSDRWFEGIHQMRDWIIEVFAPQITVDVLHNNIFCAGKTEGTRNGRGRI